MMKGKRKEGVKGEKRGEKMEKINKNDEQICYLSGEKIYIFPQSVRYLLGGGGIRFCGKIYTPANNSVN